MLYITGGYYIRSCVPAESCKNLSYGKLFKKDY